MVAPWPGGSAMQWRGGLMPVMRWWRSGSVMWWRAGVTALLYDGVLALVMQWWRGGSVMWWRAGFCRAMVAWRLYYMVALIWLCFYSSVVALRRSGFAMWRRAVAPIVNHRITVIKTGKNR